MTDIPPISEMPVAAPMRPTVRLPLPRKPALPSRRCGNCAFSTDRADRATVTCLRDGRGFDNHPVTGETFPAERGPCLHHQYRSNPA